MKRFHILLAVGLVVVLAGGGGGGYYVYKLRAGPALSPEAAAAAKADAEAKAKAEKAAAEEEARPKLKTRAAIATCESVADLDTFVAIAASKPEEAVARLSDCRIVPKGAFAYSVKKMKDASYRQIAWDLDGKKVNAYSLSLDANMALPADE